MPFVRHGTNLWVAASGDGTVVAVNAQTDLAVRTIDLNLAPSALAFDGTNIWVTDSAVATVTKLIPIKD